MYAAINVSLVVDFDYRKYSLLIIFFSFLSLSLFPFPVAAKQIPDAMMNHLDHMAVIMRVSKPDLCALLKSLYETLTDRSYITQLLTINDHIKLMSADN